MLGRFGEVLVLGRDVGEQVVAIQPDVVASLLEGDAEHFLVLDGVGYVVRVDLDDIVGAFPLGLEDSQCFVGVARSNHAVAHFAVDEAGSSFVTGVAQCDEIAIGRHAVGTTGTYVGIGQRRQGQSVDKVDFLHGLVQFLADGGTGRTDVLKGSGGGHTGGFLQFFHQLPSVQGIQEVDVSRSSVQHGDGQFPLLHVDAGRLLVGVTAVLKFKFFRHKIVV